MRIFLGRRGGQANGFEQREDPSPALYRITVGEDHHRRLDELGDRLAWVERTVGILEDHGDLAPERPHLLVRKRCNVLALEQDLAGIGLVEPDDSTRKRALAATGFADEAKRRAGCDRQADAINGAHLDRHGERRRFYPVGLAEITDLEKRAITFRRDRPGGCRSGARLGPDTAHSSGRIALDHRQPFSLAAKRRHGIDQRPGVIALGGGKEIGGRRLLHLVAGIHDHDAVGDFVDDAEIVGDQQDRRADFLVQFAEQFEHLLLHRDVERSGGFVGDDDARPASDCHGDHDALALAAGQFVRIGTHGAIGIGDQDFFQQFACLPACIRASDGLMQKDRFGDLVAAGEDWIERRHRILEDHGDMAPTQLAQVPRRQLQDIDPVYQDLAAGDHRVGRKKAHHAKRRDRLAAAAFSDQSEDCSRLDREIDIAHSGL